MMILRSSMNIFDVIIRDKEQRPFLLWPKRRGHDGWIEKTLLHHKRRRSDMVNATKMTSNPPITENVDEDDDPIDEEQLEEYREMVENLGQNPVSILPFVLSLSRVKPTKKQLFSHLFFFGPSGQSQNQ